MLKRSEHEKVELPLHFISPVPLYELKLNTIKERNSAGELETEKLNNTSRFFSFKNTQR